MVIIHYYKQIIPISNKQNVLQPTTTSFNGCKVQASPAGKTSRHSFQSLKKWNNLLYFYQKLFIYFLSMKYSVQRLIILFCYFIPFANNTKISCITVDQLNIICNLFYIGYMYPMWVRYYHYSSLSPFQSEVSPVIILYSLSEINSHSSPNG